MKQTSQLEMINKLYFEQNPLTDLIERYNVLGKRINKFIQYVDENWK